MASLYSIPDSQCCCTTPIPCIRILRQKRMVAYLVKLPCFVKPEGNYCRYKSQLLDPILSQLNSYVLSHLFLKARFNVILPSTPRSAIGLFVFFFSLKPLMHFFCHMNHPILGDLSALIISIWWWICLHMMKRLIICSFFAFLLTFCLWCPNVLLTMLSHHVRRSLTPISKNT